MGDRDFQLVVLISGRGSNLQAIIDAVEAGELSARIKAVISDNPHAYGLIRARRAGIPAYALDREPRESYNRRLLAQLQELRPNLICLAGYMRLLPPEIIEAFPRRIINIHPSLLPAFPGLNAQRQAWEYGVKVTGATVHFVDEGMDTGPIIIQEAVPVEPGDDVETLTQRILAVEHRIYVQAIKSLLEKGVTIDGRRVVIEEGEYA
ncbi:MAG: phosphoribosylglycinamide formyltransferase [Limnochordia bacterium]